MAFEMIDLINTPYSVCPLVEVTKPGTAVLSPSPVPAKKRGRPRIHRDASAKTAASRQRELEERASRLDRLLVLNQLLEKRQKDYDGDPLDALVARVLQFGEETYQTCINSNAVLSPSALQFIEKVCRKILDDNETEARLEAQGEMMRCSACQKEITGATYLLPDQPGQWCSTECRNSEIIPFAPTEYQKSKSQRKEN
jgi:hypothetical protein